VIVLRLPGAAALVPLLLLLAPRSGVPRSSLQLYSRRVSQARVQLQGGSSGEQRNSAVCGVLRPAAADDLMAGLEFPGGPMLSPLSAQGYGRGALLCPPAAGASSIIDAQRQL